MTQPLTTAEIRLAQYGQRTSTWSTATYNDGTEKALHEIALGLKAEVDRLRAELADARVQSLRDLADKADPQRPEISWFGEWGHQVGEWIRKQAEYADRRLAAAEETHVVADDSKADTLPAWLHQRFGTRGQHAQTWDALTDDDRDYWKHETAAVRRAVARGGFKTDRAAVSAAARP